MAGPWDKYGAAPSAPQAGPMVVGTPRAPDPFKVEDQQMQREAAARAREDQQFQRQSFERKMAQEENKPSDGAKTAAGYYSRALNAHKGYGEGIAPRGALTQLAVDALPSAIVNSNSSPERRAATNYAEEFIRAKLRRESGASIALEEMRKEFEVYFPIPGDEQVDIDRKATLREQALEALRNEAGSAANTVQVGKGDINTHSNEGAPPRPARPGETATYDPGTDSWTYSTGEQADPGAVEVDIVGGGIRAPEVQAEIDRKLANTDQGGSLVAGIGDSVSFGMLDEMGAGADAFVGALQGQGSIGELYDKNVAVNRGYMDGLQERDPGTFLGGQFIGGGAVPIGAGARGAAGLAKVGAAQGAAYGFGSSEGNALQRLPGAVTGGAVGGAVGASLGAVTPYVGNALAKYAPAPRAAATAARQAEADAARPVIDAAERQGLALRQPDVRPGLRGDMAAAEKSPTAGPQIGNTLAADREAMAGKVEALAPNGSPRDEYAMGNRVQQAVDRHGQRTKDEATVLYHRAKTFAPNHKVEPRGTFDAIDNRIAELANNGESANAAEIKVLEGIKADLGKSGLSIESLQTQRRAMRQRLKDNGIDYGSADASYMDILSVAGKELEGSLAANPRALNALKTANQHYAERTAFRKEIARQFIGTPNAPLKPETAATRFVSMTKSKGDYNRFSRMFKEMDGEEQADFSATIASGLGKSKSGEFGYGKFVSDLEGMNQRAIRDLFGADGAKAIEDLRMVASAKAGTAAGLNHSNTGAVTSRNNAFKDMVLTAFGGGVAGIPGAMAGAASRGMLERFTSKRAAKMLLNPDFTKWLRQIPPSSSPKVINDHFARLTNLAARDAVFAADVKALQGVLAETFSQSPGRLAAAQDETDGRREPPQGR